MSLGNPIKGQDYLVDYYAVIGVVRSASGEEIKKAIRTRMMEYHPDRFQHVAPQLMDQARKMTELLNEAKEILSDGEKKAAYDTLLANWNKAISTNGMPVIDLTASGFHFNSLIDALEKDPETLAAEREKLALQFSGFNKATFDLVERFATGPGEIPDDVQKAYAEQLAQKDLYLSLLEGFYFDSLGLKNHAAVALLTHTDQVKESINEVREQARTEIAHDILLLSTGGKALLPGSVRIENAEQAIVHYVEKVDEHVNRYAAELEQLATEREKVLQRRFELGARMTYFPGTEKYTPEVIIKLVVSEKNPAAWMSFTIDPEKNSAVSSSHNDLESLEDPAVAKTWIERGFTIITFQLQQDIDIKSQIEQIILNHIERMKLST
ncbi:MAG: molecular chaperone DnaJ [Candidatus Paceibacter sp.]|jgi:curved DNA-binding protein CbpA|nr:molecular chaperone DnaJ [Candidatus Paceibacter sp.]